jgi:hypothetical protein
MISQQQLNLIKFDKDITTDYIHMLVVVHHIYQSYTNYVLVPFWSFFRESHWSFLENPIGPF